MAFFLFFVPAAVAAGGHPELEAFDTVAGFETEISGSGFLPDQTVVLKVSKPDGSFFRVNAQADDQGVFAESIGNEKIREPGLYRVQAIGHMQKSLRAHGASAKRASNLALPVVSEATAFEVFPDDFGGDSAYASVLLAQSSGAPAARFEIENLPATADRNQTLSFTVRAVNSSGQTVSGYLGTVVFRSTDPNASLPAPYRFVSSNQGRKTFDVLLSFGTAGEQQLFVEDRDNPAARGSKTVQVRQTSAVFSGVLRITRPAPGTYSAQTLQIQGDAPASSAVRIFDNGQLIGQVQTGPDGRFAFAATFAADGEHVLYAATDTLQSQQVEVAIDSTSSLIEQVDIGKTHLAPGETTEIVIRSDPDLDSVVVTISGETIELDPDSADPGLYEGILAAPRADGEYTLNAVLTDRLGNDSEVLEIGKIIVDANLRQYRTVTTRVPSKVTGVSATPGPASALLRWSPSTAEAGMAFYRIYYGTLPGSLTNISNTVRADTRWLVKDLRNDLTYYFQVVGVDENGTEGDVRSDTVIARPSALLPPLEDEGPPVLCDPGPCPSDIVFPPRTPDDGPGVLGIGLAALLGSAVIRKFRNIASVPK